MKKYNSLSYRWKNMKKTSMKLPVLVAFLGIMATTVIPAFAGGPPPREGAWQNDQQYIMITPNVPIPLPANASAQEELYVIAPINASNPQSSGHPGIGPHDHVISVPPGNHGTFSAVWRAILIVPGPNATGTNVLVRNVTPPGVDLVYAADLNSDGTVELPAEQLTSEEKIMQAEQMGLIAEVPTPVVFVCAVVKAGRV